MRKVRSERGWSIEQLAERCAAVGGPQLTVPSLYALESGRKDRATGRRRRTITVDELPVLAAALRVHPVDLLVSPDLADDAPVQLAPGVSTTAATARAWIGGRAFLDEPETLAQFTAAIRGLSKIRAQEMSRAWFTPSEPMRSTGPRWPGSARTTPPTPSMLEAIENVAAASVPDDRDRVIREMVGTLGEVGGEDALQQLGDELNQRKKEGGDEVPEIKKIVLNSGKVRYRAAVDVGRDPMTGRRLQKTITLTTKPQGRERRDRPDHPPAPHRRLRAAVHRHGGRGAGQAVAGAGRRRRGGHRGELPGRAAPGPGGSATGCCSPSTSRTSTTW